MVQLRVNCEGRVIKPDLFQFATEALSDSLGSASVFYPLWIAVSRECLSFLSVMDCRLSAVLYRCSPSLGLFRLKSRIATVPRQHGYCIATVLIKKAAPPQCCNSTAAVPQYYNKKNKARRPYFILEPYMGVSLARNN